MATRYRYRSFFWPSVLIVVGVLALLVNSGLVAAERLDRLVDLWPLILVVVGLELLVRRAVQGQAAEIAAALIVVLAIAGAAAYVALGPTTTGTQTLDASGKAGNLDHASVQVNVGAANIIMQGSSTIGSDLFRAHIEYSGRKPDVSLDTSSGDLQISQSSASSFFFQSSRFVLDLQLNSSVRWKITVDSGASSETFNLSSVHLTGIELNTGASRLNITVGAPSGTVPITVDGGALTVNLHRPKGVSAAVAVSGGAVSVTFDGRQSHAIGDVTRQTSDYDGASDRYQIEVNGGASTVTVDTAAASD